MIERASKSLLASRICARYRDTRGAKGRGSMVVVGPTPAGTEVRRRQWELELGSQTIRDSGL